MPNTPERTGGERSAGSRQFVALAVLWGFSFLLIKLAQRSFAPLQVALGWLVVDAVTLVLAAVVRRQRLSGSWRTWGHLLIAGALLNAIPFTLLADGEQHLASVLAGIWNATTPLFMLPVAILLIADERPSRERSFGLLVGFLGVLAVLGIWRGVGTTSLEGNLICLGAAVSYGVGCPYTRRYLTSRPDGPLGLASGQLICASVQLAILTPLQERRAARRHRGRDPVARCARYSGPRHRLHPQLRAHPRGWSDASLDGHRCHPGLLLDRRSAVPLRAAHPQSAGRRADHHARRRDRPRTATKPRSLLLTMPTERTDCAPV